MEQVYSILRSLLGCGDTNATFHKSVLTLLLVIVRRWIDIYVRNSTVEPRLTIVSTYEKSRIRIASAKKFLPLLRMEIQDTNRKIFKSACCNKLLPRKYRNLSKRITQKKCSVVGLSLTLMMLALSTFDRL